MSSIETIHVGDLTVERALPAVERHPPVLFVHGIFVDAREWQTWLPRFAARGFPAYAVNLRGRSGSRPGTRLGSVAFDDYVSDAAEVARGLGRPAVVGHSMGGLIAQRLAELDVVRSAVLVTPAPPRGIFLFTAELAINQARYLPQILTNRVIVPDREAIRRLAMNCAPLELQTQALSELVPDSGRAAREISLTGIPVDASKVRCPLRVVAAEQDRFIPARVVGKIARRYRARLDVMPNHGHIVNMEPGWEALADDIASWIGSGQ
jgi:pimeloyl-ACP methyl ester carboxylesterase